LQSVQKYGMIAAINTANKWISLEGNRSAGSGFFIV